MRLITGTVTLALTLMIAAPALAGPVTLKASPVDADGQVTFGDIFDGAGSASSVIVAYRSGPSVVMEAGQLQSLARQSGLDWDNPRGLRRVVIRNAAMAPSAPAPVTGPSDNSFTRTAAPTYAARSERVISRNDIVQVVYIVGAVKLPISGRATANAAAGEPVSVLNLQSGRTIDALAVSPGQAIAGPAAVQARASLQ